MSSFHFKNFASGHYGINPNNQMSGSSSYAPTITTGYTSFTPSVSHAYPVGGPNAFGGGLTVARQVNPTTSVHAGVERLNGCTSTFVGVGSGGHTTVRAGVQSAGGETSPFVSLEVQK